MIALDPDEPVSHYNLGFLYKTSGRPADAMKQFEAAARLGPNLAGPHFQLYNPYRDPQVGRVEDAARELARFQAIKKQQAGAVIPEDLEWSYYAEIYDPVDPAAEPADPASRRTGIPRAHAGPGLDAETAGLAVLDSDADLRPDLLCGPRRVRGYLPAARHQSATPDWRGLAMCGSLRRETSTTTARPIWPNVTATDVALWRNTGGFRFHAVRGEPGPWGASRARSGWITITTTTSTCWCSAGVASSPELR